MRFPFHCTIVLSATIVVGCHPAEGGGAVQPGELRKVGSVRLAETAHAYIGRPRDFAVDVDGASFYIADTFGDRVLRFDQTGRLIRTYGRRGLGPKEIKNIGTVLPLQHILLVQDNGKFVIHAFDKASGKHLWGRSYAGEGILSAGRPLDAAQSVIVFGDMDFDDSTAIAFWRLGESDLRHLVPLATEYLQFTPLSSIYNQIAVAPRADTIAIAFSGLNRVLLADTTGRILDQIQVPVHRRRGVPKNLSDLYTGRHPFPTYINATSAVFYAFWLPDGDLLIVHFDQFMPETGGSVTSIDAYATRVDWAARRACVDQRVVRGAAARPYMDVHADTLFVLDQTVTEDDSVSTSVSKFLLSGVGCDWTRF